LAISDSYRRLGSSTLLDQWSIDVTPAGSIRPVRGVFYGVFGLVTSRPALLAALVAKRRAARYQCLD